MRPAGLRYTLVPVRNALSGPLRSLLAEPRAPNPPRRVWRDWVLVALLMSLAVLEVVVRDDVIWAPLAFAMTVGLAPTLLWRRTHPLAVVAITFGAVAIVDVAALITQSGVVGLYSMAFLIILPYSLFRWGSGREIAIGMVFVVMVLVLANAADYNGLAESFGGAMVLLFPAALGATMRYRATSRSRDLDQIRLHEREQLARELHDTVAHHVSAIAIQAQVGQTLAGSDPEASIRALQIVEEEASRTLAEMRAMVGLLREGQDAELAPQQGISDIGKLGSVAGLDVEVKLSGDLDHLGPSVEAALYRLAQESITNVRRHARNASHVSVLISGFPDSVHISVTDDGEKVAAAGHSSGYGIVGMMERTKLLGGTIETGPGPQRGWMVTAELPRQGAQA